MSNKDTEVKEKKEEYIIKLSAKECVGIQNLLESARQNVGIISAMEEIDKLLEKFRNPIPHDR